MSAVCPCGSGILEAACCRPFHLGAPAPTAVTLMRSRYTAYVRGEIDYLVATHDTSTRSGLDIGAIRAWSRDTTWGGLEIVETLLGGPGDDTGVVEFIARGTTRGTPFAQQERSRFRRTDGRWFYVDGEPGTRRPAAPKR